MLHSRFLCGFQNVFVLAISIAVGTRSQGSYVYMFMLSVLGLVSALHCLPSLGNRNIPVESRPVIALLTGYVLSLFLSGALKGGLSGLKESLALYSSIPLLFAAGVSLPFWPPIKRLRCYVYVALPLGIALVSSGLGYAVSNSYIPISSLRPSEFVLVIGLSIMALVASDFFSLLSKRYSFKSRIKLAHFISLSFLYVVFSFAVVYLFRGAISSSILIAVCFLLLADRNKSNANSLISVSVLACIAILLLASSRLMRFAVFKMFFSTFSAGDGLSDRIHLLGESMRLVSGNPERISFFGPASQHVSDFWAHNTFVDLLIHDGFIPVVIFSAFGLAYAFLWLKKCFSIESLIHFGLLPMVLFLGSLLHPVQYSDGTAYALSYACLGFSLGLILQNHESSLAIRNSRE